MEEWETAITEGTTCTSQLLLATYSDYLIGLDVIDMWEMIFRVKEMDKVAIHAILVDVFDNKLSGQILPCASIPMEREDQRLLWVVIVHESIHSFHDDL